jgi:hypothetical protein
VFFNVRTRQPQFAISESGDKEQKKTYIIIKPGDYRPRTAFTEDEFMPRACFDQRKSHRVEGPIIPLSDFGLIY